MKKQLSISVTKSKFFRYCCKEELNYVARIESNLWRIIVIKHDSLQKPLEHSNGESCRVTMKSEKIGNSSFSRKHCKLHFQLINRIQIRKREIASLKCQI